ncbi:MAG: hypothetical protein R3232_10865, partial [Clostridia bacterium]|nr:hypothetical protein [Clostridia bacterium]
MKRKSILILVFSAVLLIIIGLSIAALTGAFKKKAEVPVTASDDTNNVVQKYRILNENIISTALSKDSIPPLENPEYISVGDTLFLDDYD